MKIAILSKSTGTVYSTNRLVEAAEERGHEVVVADYTRCYCVVENGASEVYLGDTPLHVDAIVPRIGASYTNYGAAMIRQFEMLGVFTTVSSISLVRSRDKLRSLQILSKDSVVKIPRTAFASHSSNIDNLIKIVGGAPLVLKILEGTQGLGVVLAETKSAARSVVQAFYGLDVNILLQEFIKESAGEDLRIFVINGEIVASMLRKGNGEDFRANIHQGGQGLLVKLTRKEKTMAIKAAKQLGLAVAGVDIIRSDKGPLVLEVNASPGLQEIEKVSEIDVAGMIIEYVESQSIKRKLKDKIGA